MEIPEILAMSQLMVQLLLSSSVWIDWSTLVHWMVEVLASAECK